MKKLLVRVFAIVVVAALGWAGYRLVTQLPQRQREVATTPVRRGDVEVRAYARGELQAVRQMTLTAPNLFGTVQVTRLAPLGAFAREGDLVVEFDEAEVLARLEEKQLELDQIDEQIKKAEADLAIRSNQDQVELLQANYTVRRAELEVQRNELLSAIDAKKNTLNLDEAKRRLEKLKSDIVSRRAQAEAELNVLRENRREGVLELQREEQRLKQTKVLAPMSGLVSIRQARSFFFFSGMQMPDIREGDELRPGMPVADILDLSELEVVARVGELDRANLTEGQEVVIRLDALPEKALKGKIKSLSGTASADVYSNDPAKKFDVTFDIDMRELLGALGASNEQIERILKTAEENRRRAPAASGGGSMMEMMAMLGGGARAGGRVRTPGGMGGGAPGGDAASGGMPVPGMAGGGMPGRQMPGGAAAGQRRPGGRGGIDPARIIGRLPDEEKKKAQEILDKELGDEKWEDLSDEKKREIFQKLRPVLQKAFGAQRPGRQDAGDGGQRATAGQGQSLAPGSGDAPSGPPAGAEQGRRQRPGGSSQFTEAQIAAAELPPPPEEDSQLDVLLRPGLLADLEIIVEQIPDAIHIPVHAVFEKDGKPVVFVQTGNRFEERVIQPLKRSESTMVIKEGLEPGELVALADPNAKPGERRETAQPEAPSGGGGGAPMGGFGGGGRGR